MKAAQRLSADEQRVLLNCARQQMSGDLIAQTRRALEGSIAWDRIIDTAWRHGVAPLLQGHLASHALQDLVPDEAKHSLRECYVRTAFRSQTHLAAIDELRRAFAGAEVPVILLKGAALVLSTYRDPAWRPFADIDLLIREDQIASAKSALADNGYTLAPELLCEELSRRFHVNLPFVKRSDRPVHVELHWRLADRFTAYEFSNDELWSRASHLSPEPSALVLEVHDAILYLAAHVDKHGHSNQALANATEGTTWVLDELSGNRLIWFTDLHELITASAINWTLIEERSRPRELRAAISATFRLLRGLLGTEGIPDALLAASPAPWPKQLLAQSWQRAADSKHRRVFFHRYVLATRKGFELRLVRLADLWSFIFPRGEISFVRSMKALGRCTSLSCALFAARLRRFLRPRS